ncbi:hypothetical protein DOTSEDRAFT_25441 [Dothistroma septosporum NZE10]|uniref:Uncharacterized protein n=1 Tax=Dothistroma septosporum (strain NZE10 / CBS 128990) TaxID=675120 RepID=M2YPG9_DOTSN|nr:hypothetical protein DOTSEDRAFT_25441 [Dothistroma septosporum NZE10]
MPDDRADDVPDANDNADLPEDNTYCPKTSRPIDAFVEDLLPRYAEWCRGRMTQTALSQDAGNPPEEFLQAIIPRAIRHVRRIARKKGSKAAMEVMNLDGTSPLHWVMYKVRGECESWAVAAENSEDDDKKDGELEREIGFVVPRPGWRRGSGAVKGGFEFGGFGWTSVVR